MGRAHPEQEQLIADVKRNATQVAMGAEKELTIDALTRLHPTYKRNTVIHVLRRQGLIELRHRAVERRANVSYPPSHDLAWTVGLLVGRNVSTDKGKIELRTHPAKVAKIKRVAESVFGLNAPKRNEGAEESRAVTIYSRETTKRLGNLTHDAFPTTIQETYPWILKDRRYLCSLVAGILDGETTVFEEGMSTTTHSEEFATFFIDVLKQLGLQRASRFYMQQPVTQLRGVRVRYMEDLKILAQNITPVDPKYEAKFTKWKEYTRRVTSPEQMMEGWLDLSIKIGRPAHLSDLVYAEQHHERTGPSTMVFKRYFGEGDYAKAKAGLEKVGIVTNRLFAMDDSLPSAQELGFSLPFFLPLEAPPAEIRDVGLEALRLARYIHQLRKVVDNMGLLADLNPSEEQLERWKKTITTTSASLELPTTDGRETIDKLQNMNYRVMKELILIKRKLEAKKREEDLL